MVVLLVFLWFGDPEPVKLALNEPLTDYGVKGRFRMICPDGTFFLINTSNVIHFHANGHLIRKFGKTGKGPGEFDFVWTGFWDGKRYYLMDTDATVVIFNEEGAFEKELSIKGNVTKLGISNGLIYAFHLRPHPRPEPYTGMVFFENIEKLQNHEELRYFHETSKEVTKYNFNNDNHWLGFLGEDLYIADEMTPIVHVYNKSLGHLRKVELVLPEYAPSPPKWMDRQGTTRVQRLEWFCSWSRVIGFAVNKKGLLLAYEVPVENNPIITQTAVLQTDFDGKPITRVKKYDADFMGTHGGYYYLFRENDDSAIPEYWVEAVPW